VNSRATIVDHVQWVGAVSNEPVNDGSIVWEHRCIVTTVTAAATTVRVAGTTAISTPRPPYVCAEETRKHQQRSVLNDIAAFKADGYENSSCVCALSCRQLCHATVEQVDPADVRCKKRQQRVDADAATKAAARGLIARLVICGGDLNMHGSGQVLQETGKGFLDLSQRHHPIRLGVISPPLRRARRSSIVTAAHWPPLSRCE
jgi:hypothetical protein